MNNDKLTVNILRGIFFSVTLLTVITLVVLIKFDYEKFCYLILKSFGKLHRLEVFQKSYLSVFKFNIIRYFFITLSLLWIALLPYLFRKLYFFAKSISGVVRSNVLTLWKDIFFSLEKKEIIVISLMLIIFISWRIFDLVSIPIIYDEAWTYLNFTSNNIIVSASYYPAPNNHILFSIITVISNILPFGPKINIRLPNMFFAIAAFLLVFFMLKKLFDSKVAILSSAFFVVSYPVALYSMYARGYMLYIFFTILCFLSFFSIIFNDNKNKNIYWFIFITANIFGLYTMPCFLYPTLSFYIFWFLLAVLEKNLKYLKNLLISGIIISVCVLILYSPVFFINGFASVIGNKFVEKKEHSYILHNIIPRLRDSYNWLVHIGNLGYIIALLVVVLLLIIATTDKTRKTRVLSLITIWFLLMPFVFIIIHSVIPLDRTWSYLIFPIVLAIAIIIKYIFNKFAVEDYLIYSMCFFIVIYGIFNFKKTFYQDYEYKMQCSANKLSDYLLNNKFHTFYIQNDVEEAIVYYRYFVNKKVYFIHKLEKDKKIDKLKKYDAIVLDRDTTEVLPAGYSITYKDDFIKVFENRYSNRLQ